MIFRIVMLAELAVIAAALAMPDSLQSWVLATFVLATATLMVAAMPVSLGFARLLRPGLIAVLAAPALWMAV